MFKRILSVVLVLSLVISMVPTVFATEHNETSLEELLEALLGSLYEEQEQEPVKLVSLGDSMTNGYGLPGYGTYLPGAMGGTGVEDYANVAYANQFAAWLAGYTGEIGADQVVFEGNKGVVEHTRLAMSGLRAEDLHWLLELDYESEAQLDLTERTKLWSEAQINKYRAEKRDYWENTLRDEWNALFDAGDFWTWDRICGDSKDYWTAYWSIDGILKIGYTDFPTTYDPNNRVTNEMGVIAKYYQEHVAEADIITLSIGTGNFGAFLMERVTEVANFSGVPTDVLVYDVDSAIGELEPGVQAQIKILLESCKKIIADQGIEVDDGDPNTLTTMEAMTHIMLYAIVSYAVNYAGAMEAILELNPDAEIILIGLMNTLAEAEGVEVEGISMGSLMEMLFNPLNKYITALPAILKQNPNGAYADATIYYAEAPFVECLVNEYENLVRDPSSSVRNRFVKDIVGANGNGMIWSLFSGMDLAGMRLQPITLADINYYDGVDDGIIAADGKDSLKTDVERIAFAAENPAKAVSIAVYLAVEDAIIKGSQGRAVDILTFMNIGEILSDSHMFDGVMAEFMGNINNVTDAQLQAVAIVVAQGVNDTLADMLSNPPAQAVVDANDILILMNGQSTEAQKSTVYYKLIAAVAADSGYQLTADEVEAVLTDADGASALEVYYKLVKMTIDNTPAYAAYNWLTIEDLKAVAADGEEASAETKAKANAVYYKLVKNTIDNTPAYAAYSWLTVEDIEAIYKTPNSQAAQEVYCKMVAGQTSGLLSPADVAAIMAGATTLESKAALARLVKMTIDTTPAYASYTWLTVEDILAIYTAPNGDRANAVYSKMVVASQSGLTEEAVLAVALETAGYEEYLYAIIAQGMGVDAETVKQYVNAQIPTAVNAYNQLKSGIQNGFTTAQGSATALINDAMASAKTEVSNGFGEARTTAISVIGGGMSLAKAEAANLVANGLATAKETAATMLGDGLVTAKAACNTAVEAAELPCMLLGIPTNLSNALQHDDTVSMLLALFGRAMIANGIGAHPSEKGHNALFEAVKKAYEDKHTVEDQTDINLGDDPDMQLLKRVAYYLVGNAYIDLEQTLTIVNYMIAHMDALQQSDEAMVDMAKFIYETLLHNEDLSDADKGKMIANIYIILKDDGRLNGVDALAVVEEIYAYLSSNAYITFEQIFAIIDYVYENLTALMQSDEAMVDAAKFIYETLLHNDNLTDEDKGNIVTNVYQIVRSSGKLDDMEALAIVDEIYAYLSGNAYITSEQVYAIVDYVYENLAAIMQSDEAMAAAAKFVYETMLHNDDLTDEEKGNVVVGVYFIIRNTGKLNNIVVLEIVDEIYAYLSSNAYIAPEQVFAIVDCVYEALTNDGAVTDAEIRQIAGYVYFDVLAVQQVNTYDLRTASGLTPAEKVAIIEKIYAVLSEHNYLDVSQYPEMKVLADLYFELTDPSAPLVTDEQTLAIFDAVVKAYVENENIGEEELLALTTEICDVLLNDPNVSYETKVAIVEKVLIAVEESGMLDQIELPEEMQLGVVREIYSRLKAAGLMTEEQIAEIVLYLYPILVSGQELTVDQVALIVQHVYSVVFEREELTADDKIEIVTIVYTVLEEYGYIDQAIDYADPYYLLAIQQVLTEENVAQALKYIDAAIAAVKTVQSVVAPLAVSSELADVKTALVNELDAILETLETVRGMLTSGQLTNIRGTLNALLTLREELNTHIGNVTVLATQLGIANELYIIKVIQAADSYKTLVTTLANDAYNWLVANSKDHADAYIAWVEEVVAAVAVINPALAEVVGKYLMETPAEALAILYAAGDDAVNAFIAAAISVSNDVNDIIAGISAILKSDANALIQALKDQRTAVIRAEIANAKDKIAGLKKMLDEAIQAGALAETIQNYEVLLEAAEADLIALQNRLIITVCTIIEEVVDPAVAGMVSKAFAALERAMAAATAAGSQYGQWFAGRFEQMAGDLLILIINNTKEYGYLAGQIIDEMIWQFLSDAKEDVKDKIDEIIDSVEIPDVDMSQVHAVIGQLKATAGNIRAQIAALKSLGISKLNTEIEKLEAALIQVESCIDKLQTLLIDVEDLINKIDEETELTLVKVQNIVEQTKGIAAEAKALVATSKSSMEVLAKIYKDTMPAIIAILNYIEEGSPADQFMNVAGVEMGAFIQSLQSGYEDTYKAVYQAAANIETIVTVAVQNVAVSAATAAYKITDATKIAAADIISAVETAIGQIKAEAIGLVKSTDANIAAAAQQILAAIEEFELSFSKADLMAKQAAAEAIVTGLMAAMNNLGTIQSAEQAEAVLGQAKAALEALGAIAKEIYAVVEQDALVILSKAERLASYVQAIVAATAGTIGENAVNAYKASVVAILTAKEITIAAVRNALVTYEEAVVTAAGEIVTAVTGAADQIGKEAATAITIAVNAVETSIDRAETGIAVIKAAFRTSLHDATHGAYDVNCNSYYVAFGNAAYVEQLAAGLGLRNDQYAQYGLSDISKVAGANLVTVKFDNGEFLTFVYNQAMGMVSSIINNSAIGEMVHNNPTFGPALGQILAGYGVDLDAEVQPIDWSKFDAKVIEAKDEALTAVESILRDQGVPEVYVIDLGPKVMEIVNEGLSEPMVTGLKLELKIPVMDLLLGIAETTLYGYFDFATEFPATLDEIRALAPNAQVIVTGIEYLTADALPSVVTDNVDLSQYSEYMEYVVDALNLHIFAYAAINTNTTYVEDATAESILNALTVTGTDHVWGEWYTTKEATNEEDGEERRDCLNPGCTHYETREIPKIIKVDPEYTVPSDLTASFGDTLANVALPDGFTWKDVNATVGNAGVNTFIAVYTPEDTLHYNTVEVEVTITVAKADSAVTQAPAAVDMILSNGAAQSLIQAGAATGGTMVYSLTENGPFSAALPTAIDAGVYTVYYKVQGDANHNDTQVQSLTVMVYPSKITSDVHTVADAYIRKISAGLTVQQLLENINEKAYVTVFNADGTVAEADALAATGMVAQLIVNGQVVDTVTVIVTGDVNGDGKITITDMTAVKYHILEKTMLTGVYEMAADTSNDDQVSITDFTQIQYSILGKSSIEAN